METMGDIDCLILNMCSYVCCFRVCRIQENGAEAIQAGCIGCGIVIRVKCCVRTKDDNVLSVYFAYIENSVVLDIRNVVAFTLDTKLYGR